MSRKSDIVDEIYAELEASHDFDGVSALGREVVQFRFLIEKIAAVMLDLEILKQDIKFTRDSSIKNLSG